MNAAYRRWVKERPFHTRIDAGTQTVVIERKATTHILPVHYNGNCCSRSHYYTLTQDGKPHPKRGEIKPDSEVCPREQAWRSYVRQRDGLAS